MSTFDASRHGAHQAADPHDPVPTPDDRLPAGYNVPPSEVTDKPDARFFTPPDDVPIMSTLDQLRANADEADDREPITVLNPKETIRLTLRTDVEQSDIQRWSNKALPKQDRDRLNRRGGAPNVTRLNPVVMFASAIAETTIQVEVYSAATGTWTVVCDDRTQEPLTFADTTLRQVLGGIDAVSAVKRAFNGSEPALMRAGQELIDATGFGDDVAGDDDEDPTVAAG